jgi:hypothetical protein
MTPTAFLLSSFHPIRSMKVANIDLPGRVVNDMKSLVDFLMG